MDEAIRLEQSGDLVGAEARFRELLKENPGQAMAWFRLGVVQNAQGRSKEAISSLQEAVRYQPDFFDAYRALGILFGQAGRLGQATVALAQASRLRPNDPHIHYDLGLAFQLQDRFEEARSAYLNAVTLFPEYVEALTNLGNVFLSLRQSDEAEKYYLQALAINPGLARVHHNLGTARLSQGRIEEAEQSFRESLRLEPDNPVIYQRLAYAKRYDDADHSDLHALRGLLEKKAGNDDDTMMIHFSLGKILDDCGEYPQAFSHYLEGNRIRHKTSCLDEARLERYVDDIIATFDDALTQKLRSCGLETQRPVFVLGMPRSGTTLTEQILASHPDVAGRGELRRMEELTDRLSAQTKDPAGYLALIPKLDATALNALGRAYLETLGDGVNDEVKRVVDKQPYNFFHIGFIHVLFPHAKIIHCTRHPLDIAVSIFFQSFDDEMNFAYSLDDIANFYRQYHRLMQYWEALLPGRMFTMKYEDTVADIEAQARKLVAFAGVEWSEECLHFYRSRNVVQTASAWQVRQGVYSRSVERWKRYEKELSVLRDKLGELCTQNG